MSNIFLENTPELLALDTRNVLNEAVVNTVRTVETVGKTQYKAYHNSVLVEWTRSIQEPIKKNSLPLFRCPVPKAKTKQTGQLSMLKSDVALFFQLYIVMQHREGDIGSFFKHEKNPYPPSLSNGGKLRLGNKSDLVRTVTQNVEEEEQPSSFDVKILDGAAVVHLLPVTNIITFEDYTTNVFLPYITKNLRDY